MPERARIIELDTFDSDQTIPFKRLMKGHLDYHNELRDGMVTTQYPKPYMEAFADELIDKARKGDTIIYIAQVNDDVVGAVTVDFETAPENPGYLSANIKNLFIDPNRRGHGHGKALVEKCKETAKRKGCDRVQLFVMENNDSAIGFYFQLGFKPVSVKFVAGLD